MTAFLLSIPCLFATTVAEVLNWPDAAYITQSQFDVTGTVTTTLKYMFVLEDATGRVKIWAGDMHCMPDEGDVVQVQCTAKIDGAMRNAIYARRMTVLGVAEKRQPASTTVTRIVRGENDFMSVRVRGMVVGVTPDEIEPSNTFMRLSDGNSIVDVTVDRSLKPEKLVGAEIEVTGLCSPSIGCWRQFQGCGIERIPGVEYVKVLAPPPDDPFSAPPLFAIANITTRNLATLGRRSATGRVLATWHGDTILLCATQKGRWSTFQAILADGQHLPRCGEVVEIVGFPSTDLFTITLDNALCRHSKDTATIPDQTAHEVKRVTAKSLLENDAGFSQVQFTSYHGHTIRIRGKVRSVPAENPNENRMIIQSGEHMVPIDISSCPEVAADIAPECEIEVVGVCLLLADLWKPNSRMPRVRGMAVIVRDAADVKVLSRPSWWTPGRLLTVICALLLAVLAIVVWNWSLRRLVARRSKQLLKSQIAKTESDLRIGERTRLAADLHDAISQTLTGVSFHVEAAADTLAADPKSAARLLAVARQTLLSCREELRRCLWDLRNNSLEGSDFGETLRRAVRPGTGAAEVSIRFDTRRSKMSDSTAHTILCIVRELCVNAVQHGGAHSIQVEGAAERGCISFTVSDDGRGFNPSECPGPAEGHFGLQGIRERVARLNGTLAIESVPGRGAKVSVHLKTSTS